MIRTILWWGRFDPDYSRNRILRNLLQENGIVIRDFRPHSSFFGELEAKLRHPGPADAVWVPCFRHRDFRSARRYADGLGVKLVFDPLISSWDKVVNEREKYPAGHPKARRLLSWERSLFSQSDIVIADTEAHAQFFIEELSAPSDRTHVIPVGAEEFMFSPQQSRPPGEPPEILFFGSFIKLQGPQFIVEAARLVPEARWTFLGNGPLRSHCQALAADLPHVGFEDWLPYHKLAERIGTADIILGIFGESCKAARVIPNKVYQALACGRPVVTRSSRSYPTGLHDYRHSGMIFVPPADPASLAKAVETLLASKENLQFLSCRAAATFATYFSETQVNKALLEVLSALDQ